MVYAGFAVGIFFFTRSIIFYLLEDIRIGSFLLHRFISIALFIFFVAVNIGNIVVSYSTLYRSNEILFLISKPIPFSNLFTIKFLDNFFYSSTTLLLIIVSALAGYGSYFQMGWTFYAVTFFFMIIPFMISAASAAVIILLILLKLTEKIGFRTLVTILAICYISLLIIFFKISDPVQLVTQVVIHYPNIDAYFGFMDNPLIKLLPNYWASEALYWISASKSETAIRFIIFQSATALLLFTAAILLGKKIYYSTWNISLNLHGNRKSRKAITKFLSFENNSIFSPASNAILKREFWLFVREPGQWIHFIVMISLIIVFAVSISRLDAKLLNAYNPELRTIIYLMVYLFNVFLVAALSLRFIFPLLSLEGQAFGKILNSPVNPQKIIRVRFLIWFAVILILGQAVNFFSHISFSKELLAVSAVNTGLITLTVAVLNLGMGSAFVNYQEKNPIRLASSQGASITFLLVIIYFIFLIALLYYPIFEFLNARPSVLDAAIKNLKKTTYVLIIINLPIFFLSILMMRLSIKRDF
jgi:ABC-2 type transport system permease protein